MVLVMKIKLNHILSVFGVALLAAACNPNAGSVNETTGDDEPASEPVDSQQEEKTVDETGKISIPSDADKVVFEEGAAVASDVAGSYLGLPNGVDPAGPSLNIQPAEGIDANDPLGTFKITITLYGAAALVLMEPENLVVLYQVADKEGDIVYGLIPRSEIEIQNNEISFDFKGYGNYQAATLAEEQTEAIVSDPVETKILTAKKEAALPAASLAKPSGVFASATRSLALTSSVSPAGLELTRCVVVVDENKSVSYDYVKSTGKNLSGSVAVVKQTAHTLASYFECADVNGRILRSPWSNATAIAAIDPPSWTMKVGRVDRTVDTPLVAQVTAERADSYSLDLSGMDCDTASGWSTPVALNTATGAISGEGGVAGETCTIKVSATNVSGSATQTIVINSWAHPSFSCDTGDRQTVCTISSVQNMADRSYLHIKGDLVIASGGEINTSSDDSMILDVEGDLTVAAGGKIHANITSGKAENITVDAGGEISASGLSSFATDYGSPGLTGEGGAHAGAGGADFGANSSPSYGIVEQPMTMGMVGEAFGSDGGLGGGLIRLSALNAFEVNGSVSAVGFDGASGANGSGGGAGGSIWVDAPTITGSGTFDVSGGAGGDGSTTSGGGGAGGYIALYGDSAGFTGSTPVAGGPAGAASSAGGPGGDGLVHTASSGMPNNILFVTSQTYTGNRGGLGGADANCQSLAESIGLLANWRAVISDSNVSANERVVVDGPVAMRDGQEMAPTAVDFWDGALSIAPDIDESGASTATAAWTGSLADGSKDSDHCQNWTNGTSGVSGALGAPSAASASWISSNATATCDQLRSLYCISQ